MISQKSKFRNNNNNKKLTVPPSLSEQLHLPTKMNAHVHSVTLWAQMQMIPKPPPSEVSYWGSLVHCKDAVSYLCNCLSYVLYHGGSI